jgi:hypothetical protein
MPSHAYSRSLAATALAYVVLHHLGLMPSGLGTAPDDTQWPDWLDLAVPLLVLGPAALTLWAAQPATRTWALFGVGVVTYASGHGLHLSANSIGNADPSPTAHLWDEVVGHHVWYLGVALVIAALSDTMTGRPRPGPVGYLLAVAAGLTWASNAVGGGTVVMSLLLAVVAAAYGFSRRRELGVVLLVAAAPAVAVLVVELARGLG